MTRKPTPTAQLLDRFERNWPDATGPEFRLAITVQRLARILHDQSRTVLAGIELTVTEFELLAALRSAPPPHVLTPSELYEAVLLSSGGTTKVLKHLEARALIDRPAYRGDGRSRPVRLTAAGLDRVGRAMAAVQSADAWLLDLPPRAMQVSEAAAALEQILLKIEQSAAR